MKTFEADREYEVAPPALESSGVNPVVPHSDPTRVAANWSKVRHGQFYTEVVHLLGGPTANFLGFNPETGFPNPGIWLFGSPYDSISVSVLINSNGRVSEVTVRQPAALPNPDEELVAANWRQVHEGQSYTELLRLLGGPTANFSGFNPGTGLPNPGVWLFGSQDDAISVSALIDSNGRVSDVTVQQRAALPSPDEDLLAANWPQVHDGQCYTEILSLLGGPTANFSGFNPGTGLPNPGVWLFGGPDDSISVSALINEKGRASKVTVRQRAALPAPNEELVAANWQQIRDGQCYTEVLRLLGGPTANFSGFNPETSLPYPGIWLFVGPDDSILISAWINEDGRINNVTVNHKISPR